MYRRIPGEYEEQKLTGSLVKDITQHFQRTPMTLNEAIIKIEGLMEKNKGSTRRKEDIGSNQMKRGKKKFLNTAA